MPGARRLGRKRFAETVRFLKAVIADDTRSDKIRMTAVESLIAVYDRNDRTLAQYEQRRRAAEAPQSAAQPAAVAQAAESPQESLDSFLTRIKAERESRNNG